MSLANGATRDLDVTGRVAVSDPQSVAGAARAILAAHYPGEEFAALDAAFDAVERLYRGALPGYHACDMPYHDLRHVLDVTLAMARLLDGYLRSHAGPERFSSPEAVLGVVVALFHDSGYLRRRGDTRHRHGAEYTRVHVSRSARFLAAHLPGLGLAAFVPPARRLVQFTGYETDVTAIALATPRLRRLGQLIGSADILAQMADPAYLDNCRDHLFPEFALGGIAAGRDAAGHPFVRYADALDLLRQTPLFMDEAVHGRLERSLAGAHRYATVHFGGRNPYLESIARNRARLEAALRRGDDGSLGMPFLVRDPR